MTGELLLKAFLQGGPYAAAVGGWLAWWYERRQNAKLNEKLIQLATAQVAATVRQTDAIFANTKVMDRIIDRKE